MEKKWIETEEDGIIRLDVVSNGLTGQECLDDLSKKGHLSSRRVIKFFQNKDFGGNLGKKFELVILKGELWPDSERYTKNIYAKARELGLFAASPEIAYLLRKELSTKEIEALGLKCVAVMHDPVMGPDDNNLPSLLLLGRYSGSFLCFFPLLPHYRWSSSDGFAFLFHKKEI